MGEGRNLVGVDIGSSSIKVCQVKESRKGHLLTRLGYIALPPQTIVDGQVMDAGAVVESLMKVFRDSKIRQREIGLSVSGQSVIIRKIAVPIMTAAELEEQIQWEAEQHIPFDIKDVQVDYQVLRRRPEDSQMDLLLVAAKRDQINDYAQLARDAKLRPIVCDIDAFSVQNLFEMSRGMPEDQTVALINIGASLASLNIIARGVSAFTREIANGGNLITEEIQRQMGVPFDQAEIYKCGGGAAIGQEPGIVPEQVAGLIESACDSIAAEIQRSLDFYLATSGEGEITKILVTGGCANLTPLARCIERRARVGVEIWAPTEKINLDKDVDVALVEARAAQLPVALGLALRKEREVRSDTH
jgi:type IV pilus assembly protein PilM